MLTQLVLLGGAIAAYVRWPAATRFPVRSGLPLKWLGLAWIGIGLLMWIATLRLFLREFRDGRLITTGTYHLSRNPLYASLIVFVVPGIALVVGTWTILVAALLAAFVTAILVRREERELERTFRMPWRAYRARTNRLLPFPPRGLLRRGLALLFWVGVLGFLLYISIPWAR